MQIKNEKELHFGKLCYTIYADCYCIFCEITEKGRKNMKILQSASAGTMESSDAYVEIEPGEAGVQLELESVVMGQFGDAIRSTVREVLAELGVENANVRVVDRGALECVIRARVETAVLRGKERG